MSVLLRQFLSFQFVRYFLASVCALAVDMGSFLLLLQTAIYPGIAAAIGYLCGTVVQWALLSRKVFEEGTAERGRERTRQKALYLISTGAGLALTSGIVTAGEAIGANVVLAKLVAVGVSFLTIYYIRKNFVFRANTRVEAQGRPS
jgi:putative flippase GtrA